MNVFDLLAKISLDSKDYEEGLKKASTETDGFGQKLKSGLSTAGGIAVGVVTAVSTAVIGLASEMSKGITKTAEYGDNIDKMSQKMGISAKGYQEWDFILQHSGSSIDAMSRGMITLQKNAADSADKFEALGISQEQVASMSTEDLFAYTIQGLQEMEDGAERTALANDLLGGAVKQLGPLLNTSAEDTEEMRKQVNELGGIMSDEAVKASAQFEDSLQNLQWTMQGLKRGAFSEFLPAVVDIMDGLTSIFSNDSDSGISLIADGVDKFAKKLSDMIPKVMSIGSQIVISLIKAISSNLPKMISGGTDAVMTFINGIVQMLPSIIDSGVQVIVALVQGIGQSLPELIPAVVGAILQIVQTLVDNINLLIDGALTFMLGFIDGIIQAIPIIIEALPELINGIIDGILGAIPQIIEAGIQLFVSLINAIPQIISGIVEHIPEIIDGIVSGLTDNLPTIIEAGVELFISLIENIPDIISGIVEQLPKVISGIVKGLTDNLPTIIEAGVQLFISLIENIPAIIAGIVEHLPEIITGIVTGIASLGWNIVQAGVDLMKNLWKGISSWAENVWDKAKEIGQGIVDKVGGFFEDMWENGKNLVVGLWNGIGDKINWIKEKISGWVNDVLGWFKNLFGIKSPSRVMAQMGDMLDQGLAKGMDDNIDDVLDMATEIHDGVNEALEGMGASVDVDTSDVPDLSNLSLKQTNRNSISEELLSDISIRLDNLEQNMYEAISRALADGFELRWNDRELTRLVKEYAR